jgi:hypothetical protein
VQVFQRCRSAQATLVALPFAWALLNGERLVRAEPNAFPLASIHRDTPPTARTVLRSAGLQDLTGIRILHTTYGNFAGVPTSFVSDLVARGAVVETPSYTTNPYPMLDDTYDVLLLHAIGEVPSGQDLADLLAWVRSGSKGVLFAGVTFWLIDTANVLANSMKVGWVCESDSLGRGIVTDIDDHRVTANVDSLESVVGYYTHFVGVVEPANALFRYPTGETVGAYATLEKARIVYIGMSVLWDNRLDLADNRLFANQVIDWLAERARVEPATWSTVKTRYRE